MQRLRERLDRLKGKWLVSLNDAPSIRAIFADCRLTAIDRPRGVSQAAGQAAARYRELVIEQPPRP